MAHVDDGDKRYIRREYVEVSKLDAEEGKHVEIDDEGIQEPNVIETDDDETNRE